MSVEENNKALVRRLFDAHARGDLYAIDELLAPDFVDRSLLPGQEPGPEGFKRSVAADHSALSDLRFIVDAQIATGDEVVTRFTTRSIHDRGKLGMGLAPTGQERESTGIFIHRIVEGKIAEEWSGSSGMVWAMEHRLEEEAREHERVEQELRVARRIQQASLPEVIPTLEGWEITTHYRPAQEVGGDFYDFVELVNGHLGIVVGDATGKGVPAALVMATTCGMLRAVAQSSNSPSEVLGRVNEALSTRIPANMFVTCFYAILDLKSGSVSYANAGHDLPYLRHRNSEAEELRARGMSLGLMPGTDYEEKEVIITAGEAALFYSDGLVEAHDPKGEMFSFPRLRALVAEHGEECSLGEFLIDELSSFVGEYWEQEDDITLVTLRRSMARS